MKKTPNEILKAIEADLKKRDELKPLFDQCIRAVCEKYGIARNTVQKPLDEHGIVKDKEKTGAGKIEPSPEMLAVSLSAQNSRSPTLNWLCAILRPPDHHSTSFFNLYKRIKRMIHKCQKPA